MVFSIITATFNSEKTLERTIKSLLSQNISNFEYIIVDGKSTDSTLDIIKAFENEFKNKKIPFTWISEKDKGIYDAFNKGIKLSKGNWISFLGSDDYYIEGALESYIIEIEKLNENFDFIHSNVKVDEKKIIKDKWEWKKFKRSMNIAHVGAFHNMNYFKKYGLYNTDYKIAGDYELLLRAKDSLKAHWFNKITAVMADGGVSNSQVKNVYLETTKAKIKSGKIHFILSKIDYYTWMFKYRVKSLLNAIIK